MPLASIADYNQSAEEVSYWVNQAKKLSGMYDDFILLDKEDSHERPPGIHASELYPCLRKPVYSLTNVEKRSNISKFWKQRFKVGHAIHAMMQKDFHAMAKRSQRGLAMRVASKMAEEMNCTLEFEDEAAVDPEKQEIARYYTLYSHADGIFTFRDKETKLVVLRVGLEIKTESGPEYEKLQKPKEQHVRQAHLYMGVLDLPLMWFFYMNKSNQNNTNSQAPWLITFDHKIWKELEERFITVHNFARAGQLPDRTEGIFCEFCPWAWTCEPQHIMKALQQRDSKPNLLRGPGVLR